MAAHNQWGKTGEELAANLLLAKGYKIRHRNWRSGRKEIDIVAECNGTLAFVEVKTRSTDAYGNPEEAVDGGKIRHIVAAADAYLREFGLDLPVRFDIISIIGSENNYRIDHIEDAFFPPLWT